MCGKAQVIVAASASWAPGTFQVDNVTPQKVASANARRTSVLIVNDGAVSAGACHVTNQTNASLNVGGRSYPLAVGEGVTIATQAEVYIIADSAAGATVKVIEEFS